MGDPIAVTPSEHHVLHKANSGAIRFKMKLPSFTYIPIGVRMSITNGPTITLTAKHSPNQELYKLVMGNSTTLIDVSNNIVQNFTNDINFGELNEFWLCWHSGNIRLGIVGLETPLLEHKMSTAQLIGYIQFDTGYNNWHPVEWIIETSPVVLKPVASKQFDDELKWSAMVNGKLPPDALIGGFENEPIYIARAHHNHSLCPGKYVPSKNLAFVPWGRREHPKSHFEILCGFNAQWIKTSTNNIPVNAFVGGTSEVQNEPLYIGRAMHEGNLLTGKIHVRYKTCFLPYDGKEVEVYSYEILVLPGKELKQAIYPWGES